MERTARAETLILTLWWQRPTVRRVLAAAATLGLRGSPIWSILDPITWTEIFPSISSVPMGYTHDAWCARSELDGIRWSQLRSSGKASKKNFKQRKGIMIKRYRTWLIDCDIKIQDRKRSGQSSNARAAQSWLAAVSTLLYSANKGSSWNWLSGENKGGPTLRWPPSKLVHPMHTWTHGKVTSNYSAVWVWVWVWVCVLLSPSPSWPGDLF